MNLRLAALFTKKRMVALALTGAMVAAGAGWKLGGTDAVGHYLIAPVTIASIE